MRLLLPLLSLVVIGLGLTVASGSAQDDIYLPPEDELVISEDGGDEFEDDAPYVFPGNGFPASELCLQFLADQGIDPDEGAFFGRLPSVCYWRYAGYPCEPENNPPEGWLRPGGYCDKNSLPRFDQLRFRWPERPVPALGTDGNDGAGPLRLQVRVDHHLPGPPAP